MDILQCLFFGNDGKDIYPSLQSCHSYSLEEKENCPWGNFKLGLPFCGFTATGMDPKAALMDDGTAVWRLTPVKLNANKYILVVIDNFSRFVIVRPMLNKTAKTTARLLEQILNEIKKKNKGVDIKNIITDDGSEFKGEVIPLLKKRGIGIRRALGGNPQQNGIVERANGKIKNIIKKNIDVKAGSWTTHLQKSVDAYNRQLNRGIGFAPNEAVKLDIELYRAALSLFERQLDSLRLRDLSRI